MKRVPAERLRVLVFGAGVLGSFYAARLASAGHDVTVVARGRRYRDLVRHGIVLEFFDTKERTTSPVRVVDRMPEEDRFDVCLVLVRKTQLAEALPVLATGTGVAAFLFMVNNAEGPQAMIDAVGRDRVLLGFANAGGERDGHLVRVMEAQRKGVTLGELAGVRSERLERIAAAFRQAGFRVEISADMDAWLRYHVALVGPFANERPADGAAGVARGARGHRGRAGARVRSRAALAASVGVAARRGPGAAAPAQDRVADHGHRRCAPRRRRARRDGCTQRGAVRAGACRRQRHARDDRVAAARNHAPGIARGRPACLARRACVTSAGSQADGARPPICPTSAPLGFWNTRSPNSGAMASRWSNTSAWMPSTTAQRVSATNT